MESLTSWFQSPTGLNLGLGFLTDELRVSVPQQTLRSSIWPNRKVLVNNQGMFLNVSDNFWHTWLCLNYFWVLWSLELEQTKFVAWTRWLPCSPRRRQRKEAKEVPESVHDGHWSNIGLLMERVYRRWELNDEKEWVGGDWDMVYKSFRTHSGNIAKSISASSICSLSNQKAKRSGGTEAACSCDWESKWNVFPMQQPCQKMVTLKTQQTNQKSKEAPDGIWSRKTVSIREENLNDESWL